jgi:hypothetical protein
MHVYIMEQCSHELVEDSIDIDPDRSMQIFYCKKCEKNYTFEEFILQDISGCSIIHSITPEIHQ